MNTTNVGKLQIMDGMVIGKGLIIQIHGFVLILKQNLFH
jgi:hypothetical protein